MQSGTLSSVHLRTHDKLLSMAVWVGSAALFFSVGWLAVEPDDPQGAVSLLTRSGALFSVVELMALAAVVSGLATVLLGRKVPDAGVFAVGVGLAVMALRGQTSAHLLINVADEEARTTSSLAGTLAFEGLVWFLPVLVAMLVSGIVVRWFAEDESYRAVREAMSLEDVPVLGGLFGGVDRAGHERSVGTGLKATLICLLAAIVLFRLLATGSPLRSVQHGQVCFALVAAFYLGGLIAGEFTPVRSAFWLCLAVPLLCLLGYFYCAFGGGSDDRLATVPPSVFFRALPIQYVGVGTAAAVASFWHVRRSAVLRRLVAAQREEPKRRRGR